MDPRWQLAAQGANLVWTHRKALGKGVKTITRGVGKLFTKKGKKVDSRKIVASQSGPVMLRTTAPISVPSGGMRISGPRALPRSRGRADMRSLKGDAIVIHLHQTAYTLATNNAGVVNVTNLPLNTSMLALISKFATLYRQARMRGCSLTYTPICGDTTPGVLLIWADYSVDVDPATNTETFTQATDNSGAAITGAFVRRQIPWKRQDNVDDEFITIADGAGLPIANKYFHGGGVPSASKYGHHFFIRGANLPVSTNLGVLTLAADIEFKQLY